MMSVRKKEAVGVAFKENRLALAHNRLKEAPKDLGLPSFNLSGWKPIMIGNGGLIMEHEH